MTFDLVFTVFSIPILIVKELLGTLGLVRGLTDFSFLFSCTGKNSFGFYSNSFTNLHDKFLTSFCTCSTPFYSGDQTAGQPDSAIPHPGPQCNSRGGYKSRSNINMLKYYSCFWLNVTLKQLLLFPESDSSLSLLFYPYSRCSL